MGNAIVKSDCINLEGQEITRDSYTVKRTSQQMEINWVMGAGCGSPDWITYDAFKRDGEWRIFMNNTHTDIETIAHGWRRLSTIYPTRLEGDDDGINEWRKMVCILLEELEEVRVQAELAAKEPISAPPPVEEPKRDPYDHKVETCPCGICETARYHRDTWKSSK